MKCKPYETSATRTFTNWKTFRIGGVSKDELLGQFVVRFEIHRAAWDIIKQIPFDDRTEPYNIETVWMDYADFGLERWTKRPELYNPDRLAEWSAKNSHRLPKGYVVEMLPEEASLPMRLQWVDQMNVSSVALATKDYPVRKGARGRLGLRRSDSVLSLTAFHAEPYRTVSGDYPDSIFRLRRL